MKGFQIIVALLLTITATAHAGTTLDTIKKRGFLQCGVSDGLPGFSQADKQGHYSGLDVDICRAIAVAVLGDAKKVKFTPLIPRERFSALQAGKVDVLSRNTTWTSSRDTTQKVHFTAVTYYDGQGFLVHRKLGVKSVKELNETTICMQGSTTTELNLRDYFHANGMKYTPIILEKSDEAAQALATERCDALTSDQSQLYAQRLKLENPDEYVVLPEVISKEPLGLLVRHGDDEWFDIVRWTLFVLINAEELSIHSKNIEDMEKSANPDVKRLLGIEGDKGKDFGLSNQWMAEVIRQVGNYSEIFDRNVGKDSPLKINRGLNALWIHGGLQYAPPVR